MTLRTDGGRAALAAAVVALLAACTGAPAGAPEEDASAAVAFADCSAVACEGSIDGAAYRILLPDTWNGTLLLWSHGYRSPQPAPPSFSPVSTFAEPAPGWDGTSSPIADELLAQGYALAGSAYSSNGWAVADGIKAGEDLHAFFAEQVGQPRRTYVWGASLGGLITQVLAERNPDWVSGVMPTCGAVAGPILNFDLALDVAYAIKALIDPELKLTGFASWDEAVAEWQRAASAVLAAGGDIANGAPKLALIGAIADAPRQTKTFDGGDPVSQLSAVGEAALTALGFATFSRWEMEQRVGGNPSDNTAADYAARVSADERALIETISPGATDRLLTELAVASRVAADPAAREALSALGDPTGAIKDPTITLHTAADPLVIVQNETVLAERAAANPDRTAKLVQIYTAPPSSYDAATGAPYGAGHCNFTPASMTALVSLLDEWVREGAFPSANAIDKAFAADNGLESFFKPGEWPASEAIDAG
jgi:pimeloyl-ACP methyl ester carboxylesterase